MTDKEDRKEEYKDGILHTWDSKGNCFLKIPVNNIPIAQYEEWSEECKQLYSGQRWNMIWAEHIKAKAYDNLVYSMIMGKQQMQQEQQEQDKTDENPLGLLNPDV